MRALTFAFVLALSFAVRARPRLLTDLRTGVETSAAAISQLVPYQGRLLFCAPHDQLDANDKVARHDAMPWETDGTKSGTQVVIDPAIEGDGSCPNFFAQDGQRPWFVEHGREDDAPWSGQVVFTTDGTSAGTLPVGGGKDAEVDEPHGFGDYLCSGPEYEPLAELDDSLFFFDAGGCFLSDKPPWLPTGTLRRIDRAGSVDALGGIVGPYRARLGDAWFVTEWSSIDRLDASGGLEPVVEIPDGVASGLVASESRVFGSFELGVSYDQRYPSSTTLVVSSGDGGDTPERHDFPGRIGLLGAVGRRVVLTGSSGDLEVSDGTDAGTGPLALGAMPWSAGPFASIDGRLLLVLTTNAGAAVWSTDGSVAGSRPLFDATAPTGLEVARDADLLVVAVRNELWMTDGTIARTFRLATLPRTITAVGIASAGIVAATQASDSEAELWRVGENGDTERLDRAEPPSRTSIVGPAARLGDRVITVVREGNGSSALLVTDGRKGTLLETTAVPVDGFHPVLSTDDQLFFTAKRGDVFETWRTDGTVAGSAHLSEFDGTLAVGMRDAGGLVLAGTTAFDQSTVWRTNALGEQATEIATLEGRWPVVARDTGPLYVGTRVGLWAIDAAGTRQLASSGEGSLDLLAFGGDALYLGQHIPDDKRELWWTDGTIAGTRNLAVTAGAEDPPPHALVRLGDVTLYLASDPNSFHDLYLWRTDGTESGTFELADAGDMHCYGDRGESMLCPKPTAELVVSGPFAYFTKTDDEHGEELWRSDGTLAGTQLVADLVPGGGSSWPEQLIDAGHGRLVFRAADGAHGFELWETRGDAASTRVVADVRCGPESSFPADLVTAGDHLFFDADDGAHGRELWALPLADLDAPNVCPDETLEPVLDFTPEAPRFARAGCDCDSTTGEGLLALALALVVRRSRRIARARA